jgi:hypothetical protein
LASKSGSGKISRGQDQVSGSRWAEWRFTVPHDGLRGELERKWVIGQRRQRPISYILKEIKDELLQPLRQNR